MKKITFLIVLLALFSSWCVSAQVTTYPYSEDFEAGAGGWTANNGSVGTWALGTPAANVINSAASGTKAWTTNLTGNYNPGDASNVQSPVFDLSSLSAPSIEFRVWWNTEFSWDGMVLQSSINSGATWQKVGAFGDANNWYNDNSINSGPGGQSASNAEGWSGRTSTNNGSNGWRIARHALTGLAGQSNVILRFAFSSDTSGQDNGVAFDLVSIFEVACPEPANLVVSSIVATDATLSWTAGGSQSQWEYLNLLDGATVPTTADSGTPIATNSVSLSNLTEGQNYDFYVRTVCAGGEFSSWVGPLNYAISGPGETCGNPLVVTTPLPYVTSDDTANYLDDYDGSPGDSCGPTFGYLNGDDVVYAYTPDADTSIDIKLSNISDTYAGIFVYNDCAAIGVSCLTGATNSFSQTDLVIDNFTVTGGQTYYIVISTWASPQSIAYTLTITENTCVDPVVAYNVVGDCEVAPQFFVEANLTNLGTATSITLTDNQGNAPQTTTEAGVFTFGPYPNTTDIIITVANNEDANCTLTSPTLTQEFCQDFIVDCAVGASTLSYCYDNGGDANPVVFTFTSSDGNSLNLTFNAGTVENNYDELVVIDTDGSFIVAPADQFYGANGNLSGLTYQSTGDTISFYINSESSGSCQSSGYIPIDASVTCATCINPAATFAVRGDCLTAPQFFVDVDITDLGSAGSLTVTDNQGSASQTVTTAGLISFGPYPNTTSVQITVANDDDINCVKVSSPLTQPFCLENVVDCNVGPLNISYCYTNNDTNVFSYVSSTGTPLNLSITSGQVEGSPYDTLVIFDTDGVTELYNGEGNNGDLSGLSFQSTGDTIYFSIDSEGIFSCEDGFVDGGIIYTVSCATCINPAATFAVIDDCANGEQFLVDVNVTSLGDATTVTINDNQGSAPIQVSSTGIVQVGPFPFGTPIIISLSNDQDVNCVIQSLPLLVPACPPANDNCAGATVAGVNAGETCDIISTGTLLAATPSGVPGAACGNPDDDVWFQFTALSTQHAIQITNTSSDFNTIAHAVYQGSCGSLVELYCTTDDNSITPELVPGTIYYIRVFSFGNQPVATNFNLCIQTLGNPTYCFDALPICAGITYNSATGDGVAPPYLDYGCLFSQPDPTWNTILFNTAGDYVFTLDQDTFNPNDNDDVDFILWGPYNNQDGGCVNLLPQNIVDCSYSASDIETITINGVQAGDIYILLITNYGQSGGTFTFTQNSGPENGTNCEVVCGAEIVYEDVTIVEDPNNIGFGLPIDVCGQTSIELTGSSPYADTYTWYLDGFEFSTEQTITVTESGEYQVVVSGQVCENPGESLIVQVNIGIGAVANPVDDIVTCDDASGDGFESFDLSAQTPTILGTQDPAQFTVTYYATLSDAESATGALTSPYTNTSNPQTIYVRVETSNGTGCYATTSFDLSISGATPTATSSDITLCDDDSLDGFESFDLAENNVNILNGQSAADYSVTYYLSEADANAGTSPLASPYTNTTNPQTIWARVDNVNAVSCYAIVDLDLVVDALPVTTFATDITYEVCPDATEAITITATPQNYSAGDVSIVWTQDGVIIPGQTGLTLPVLTGGLYEIQVTFTETGCPADPIGVTVVELENCIIPQGISPDGDGKNDTFDLSSFNVKRLEIFNRLGRMVYSKDNYTDEWYGQTDNGDELPIGTYFYTMIYDGGAKTKSSWVYINK